LKQHLTGNFDVASTNLNLSVVNIRNPLLKATINVVAMIPELLKNPESIIGTALTVVSPKAGAGQTGGLASELEKSPINTVILRGAIGGGNVQLQQTMVQSAAFQADATGTVRLEDVLTNSVINIPVAISLSREIAQRYNLVPPNTPTKAAYVRLPDFLTLTGTVGNPDTKKDKVALVGLAAKAVGSLPIGGQAGSILQGVGGLLGGTGTQPPATNAPGVTNAPAKDQNPVGNLLNQFLKPKKK
jgi:hypothetical protein